MDAHSPSSTVPRLSPEALEALSTDPNAAALIKAFLAIPDEAVKRKLRRLAEEIAVPIRRATKSA
jgi:hypothetical protein